MGDPTPEAARPGEADAPSRLALVTGASRGIGAAVAVELARHGVHVVLLARTTGGLEETDDLIRNVGGYATLLPLDLLDGTALDRVGPSLFERFGRLDALVHAAGALGRLTPVGHIQDKDWAEAAGVSLAAAWRLIRTCTPLLERADAGRAVFLTDSVADIPRAYWGAYGAAKAGMEHLVRAWALETHGTTLRANLCDPGPVATRLRAAAMPGEDPKRLRTPADVAPGIAALCDPAETRHGELVRLLPGG